MNALDQIAVDIQPPPRRRSAVSWATYRGLALLPRTRIDRGTLNSAWVAFSLRHGPKLFNVLRFFLG